MTEHAQQLMGSVNLTVVQQQLLMSHNAHPDKGHQNTALVLQFAKGVDAAKLADAFAYVVTASDILRTIVPKGSIDRAEISPTPPASTDIRHSDHAAFVAWCATRPHRPLDLTVAAYESVIAVHPDQSLSWYLNLHHLINDAQSAATVLQAVEAAYTGQPVDLRSFYDLEQSAVLQGPALAQAQTYWAERQAPPRLERLFGNLKRTDATAEQVLAGTDADFGQKLTNGLTGPYRLMTPAISRAVFWVFTAALYTHRVSGAGSFSIGAIVNHRTRLSANDIIGPLIEIFPVDVTVHDTDSHQDLFQRVAEAFYTTMRNAQPGTAPASNFDVLVNVLPDAVAPDMLLGQPCRVSWLFAGATDAQIPLRIMDTPYALLAQDADPGRRIEIEIADDARGACSATTIAETFSTIVHKALAEPDATVASYPVSSAADHALIAEWAHTPPLIPDTFTLRDALEARLTGNGAIVVVEGNTALTGDALWSKSVAFAASLARDNAGARIGVQIGPSIQALIAIYGTLLSGRSYVPLEPALPQSRLDEIIAETGTTDVITTRAEVDQRSTGAAQDLPVWDKDAEAYVFFTSGSTGKPRGVSIKKAGLDWHVGTVVTQMQDRVGGPVAPMFGSLGFDISLHTLFAPILSGGKLIVFDGHPADAMLRIARTKELTWLEATPSHLEILLPFLPADHNLTTMIFIGEALNAPLAAALRKVRPSASMTMYNCYGPTESVVHCMEYHLCASDLDRTGPVPIGRPMPGVTIQVMDTNGLPVPAGAIGELWISSDHIMESYLGWTPEASGIVHQDGKRFYRSGDLVNFDVDGNIVFQGRADLQMKIGGIRIDPIEVEQALTSHPHVQRAVVALRQVGDDDRQTLVAWVVADGAAPDRRAMRAFLKDRVPRHAIPQAIVPIDAIPLNTSGKVNMRDLPDPVSDKTPVAPVLSAQDLETRIISQWQTRLREPRVDPDDDFFALGGDSLAALQMVLELGRSLDLQLDEGLAFRATTPRDLAAAISAAQPVALQNEPPASIQTQTYTASNPPPLVDTEMAILLHHQLDPSSERYNTGRIFTVDGIIDPAAFRAALEQVAAQHIPLCWTFGRHRKPLGAGQRFAFSSDTAPLDSDAVIAAMHDIRRQPYDLETGPMLRCHLQRTDDGGTAIGLLGHHVAFDHDSLDQLIKQVSDCLDNGSPTFPPIDFPAVSHALEAACAQAAESYWQAAHLPEPASLAPMRSETSGTPGRYIHRELAITKDALASGAGASSASQALAAAGAAVQPWLTDTQVDLSLIISRGDAALADLVGCSLNAPPLTLNCDPQRPLADVAQDAADTTAALMPIRRFSLMKVNALRREMGKPLAVPRFFVAVIAQHSEAFQSYPMVEYMLDAAGSVAPMTFFLITQNDTLSIGLEHDRRIIPDAVAQTALDIFGAALDGLATHAGTSLRDAAAPHLTQSIVQAPPLQNDANILTQIFQRLTDASDANALESRGGSINWATLGTRAQAVSDALRTAGIQPGDHVAIAMQDRVQFITCILGVLGAGATYVPVDPQYPKDRIKRILDVANPALCLCDVSVGYPTEVQVTDAGIAGQSWPTSGSFTPVARAPDSNTYMIFTSGSTGVPASVLITDAQLNHSTNARAQVYDAAPKRFALLSSLAFDSSVVGLFWTLANGGCLVVPDEDALRDPVALAGLLGQNISHVLTVPTLYAAMLDSAGTNWPAHVILAGEALPPALTQRHFTTFPQTQLTNEYGLTEGTVWSHAHHVSPDEDAAPIGTPVPGTWAAIVDETGQPVPHGVAGELIIGGPLIAQGYVDQSEKAAARFLNGQDHVLPDGRAFRTGDLAAVGPDGFYVLGRTDDQINIGGVRLDPSEVEAVLEAQPDVHRAVVVAHDNRSRDDLMAAASQADLLRAIQEAGDGPDKLEKMDAALRGLLPANPVLAAHIEATGAVDIAALRRVVSAALPPRHAPTIYHIHDALPQTPNGKIDRRALANHRATQPQTALTVPAPTAVIIRDEDVLKATKLFSAALKNTTFGPGDSFFEFGGNSLLGLRLLLELEKAFDVSLPASTLYDAPTPRSFCEQYLGTDETTSISSSPEGIIVVPYGREGPGAPIFALHNIETNGSLYRPFAERIRGQHPFFGIGQIGSPSLTGDWVLDLNSDTTVPSVSTKYVNEIERISPSGPIVLMGFCLGAVYAYEVAQQLRQKGRRLVSLIMLNDLHAPELTIAKKPRLLLRLAFRKDQIRRASLSDLGRIAKRAPNALFRLVKEARRYGEILALKSYRKRNKSLTSTLARRNVIEESYWNVKGYEYLPYDGPTLAVRMKDSTVSASNSNKDGWGNRLSDLKIVELECDPFEKMLLGSSIDEVADIVLDEIQTRSGSPDVAEDTSNMRNDRINHKVRKPQYEIALSHDKAGFIDAPREEQRAWLIQQRLTELSRELEHLDAMADQMVPATGTTDVVARDETDLHDDQLMELWQVPVMQGMVDLVAHRGQDVLEIGYGRGASAAMIQERGVGSHTIVECNPHVVRDCEEWRDGFAGRDIRILEGLWQDVTEQFGKYDGILFHTYPLDEEELVENLAKYSTFSETFFDAAAAALKPGGIFTYYTSEADSISRAHQRALLSRFESFSMSRLPDLNIPDNSADALWFQSVVLVKAVAKGGPK